MRREERGRIRDANIEKLVAREVAAALAAAEDERIAALAVVRVVAGRGGTHILVLFGPAPDGGDVAEATALLERACGWIRSELAAALDLKRVPELTFAPEPAAWAAAGDGGAHGKKSRGR